MAKNKANKPILTSAGKQPRILDPKSDIVFKKIFGQHPELVKSFLNNILPLPEGRLIEEITYLTPEQSPRIPSMKNTIVDVRCKDQDGRIFVVEMQMLWHSSFDKRLIHGASRAFSQQLGRGGVYADICAVYGLAIINEIFDDTVEDWYHHYSLNHRMYPGKFLDGLDIIFVELPKFKPQTLEHKKLGILWLRFLNEINVNSETIPEDFENDPDLALAVELAKESSYTEAELLAYDQYLDALCVERSVRHDAYEGGKEEGKRDNAKRMIRKGYALEEVEELTTLSIGVVRQLAEEVAAEAKTPA